MTPLVTAFVAALAEVSLSAPPADDVGARVGVLFRAQSAHRRAASAIQQELRGSGADCVLIELPARRDEPGQELALKKLVDARPTIVATGGTKATMLALQELPSVPIIFFLVPNALDAPFMMDGCPARKRTAGVTTDVAPEQQIKWLTALCPQVKRIGVLASARTKQTAMRMKTVGWNHAITVTPIEASRDNFMAAINAINSQGCDAILMIPDAQVYNSATVQRLLLWGVRQKKPVLAFSSHVVKAGAFAGQYCDNEAIGRQTAQLIKRVIEGTDIASIGLEYPKKIHSGVNEHTAEMIGITLDHERITPHTVRYGGAQ